MKYRDIPHTNLNVSLIGLGTMTWGEQNTEAEAHVQLDYAVDAGINFIDTAELYPVDPRAETQGRTEAYIGNWLNKRKDRDKLIIASKVCASATDWLPYLRNGNAKLDRKNIEAALNTSLKRLQTDYLDLYQLHWPERDTNYFGKLGYYHAPEKDGVPIEETLEALNDLVQIGKIRHIGISNETAWGTSEYLRISDQKQFPRIVSIQNPYNLLNRTFEVGLSEFSHREDVGLLAYSPMAFGVLSGKYLNGARPEGARVTLFKRLSRYSNENAVTCTAAYVNLANASDLDPAQMALAFVNTRPFLTSNIIGATNMTQLKSNIASLDVKLPKDVLREIENIHFMQANPCP
jgi:aryl-alcohol dehydrogenase-like predicted oxidoreductase